MSVYGTPTTALDRFQRESQQLRQEVDEAKRKGALAIDEVYLAVVDPAYIGVGAAKVTFAGAAGLSATAYDWVGDLPPLAGSTVVLNRVGSTFIITGRKRTRTEKVQVWYPTVGASWTEYERSLIQYGPVRVLRSPGGVVWIDGMIAGGTVTAGTVLFTLPEGWRPTALTRWSVVSSNGQGVIEINTNGQVIIRAATSTYIALHSVLFHTGDDYGTPLVWTPLTIITANGYSAGAVAPAYAKDSLGRVWLRGILTGSSTTTSQNFALLPAGFRPSAASGGARKLFSAITSTNVWSRFDIDTSGNMVRMEPATSLNTASRYFANWWLADTAVQRYNLPLGFTTGANYASGYAEVGFMKFKDGMVAMRGMWNGTLNNVLSTLLPPIRLPYSAVWAVGASSALGFFTLRSWSGAPDLLFNGGAASGWVTCDDIGWIAEDVVEQFAA